MADSIGCRLVVALLPCVLLLCLLAVGQAADSPPAVVLPEPGRDAAEASPGQTPKAKKPASLEGPAAAPKAPPVLPPLTAPEESPPSPPPAERSPRPTTLAYSSPILRLASVPNMLGDSFGPNGQLEVNADTLSLTDIPLAGASRHAKIADNNKSLPMNRCYFTYQHFNNALATTADLAVPGTTRFTSVDRYTIGLEKMFLDNRWSIDVRMPFTSDFQVNELPYAVEGGDIGNLAVILKRVLVANECGAVAIGMGIDTPTGSDVNGRVGAADLLIRNDAVHLAPFIGFLRVPNERLFYQGFLQVDVAANGNQVQFTEQFPRRSPPPEVLHEQTVLYLDLSAGYWLYRDPCACRVTGPASMVEFHYTGTLNDGDILTGTASGIDYRLGDLLGQIDFVNLTVGLHAELANRTTVRVAGVFPLENGPQKPFDAEVQVSINRRF